MKKSEFHHRDCCNFASVDVIKGICHLSKEMVLADSDNCINFEMLPKCAHCRNFSQSDQEYLGICEVSPMKFMTYPDLIALTCENFEWRA